MTAPKQEAKKVIDSLLEDSSENKTISNQEMKIELNNGRYTLDK